MRKPTEGGVVSQVDGSGCILAIGSSLGIALHFAMLLWIVFCIMCKYIALDCITFYKLAFHSITFDFTKLNYVTFFDVQ